MPRLKLSNVHHSELLPDLKDHSQWLCWYPKKDGDGKLRKKPFPHNDACSLYEQGVAKYSDKTNWLSYSEATTVQSETNMPLGLGFVLSEGDDFVVLDLDYCITKETIELVEPAFEFLNQSSTYAELSPSGTGLHILTKGDISRQGWSNEPDGFRIEVYNKFFMTVTQEHISGTPQVVKYNQEFLDHLFETYSISWPDPKFTSFWPGRTE